MVNCLQSAVGREAGELWGLSLGVGCLGRRISYVGRIWTDLVLLDWLLSSCAQVCIWGMQTGRQKDIETDATNPSFGFRILQHQKMHGPPFCIVCCDQPPFSNSGLKAYSSSGFGHTGPWYNRDFGRLGISCEVQGSVMSNKKKNKTNSRNNRDQQRK